MIKIAPRIGWMENEVTFYFDPEAKITFRIVGWQTEKPQIIPLVYSLEVSVGAIDPEFLRNRQEQMLQVLQHPIYFYHTLTADQELGDLEFDSTAKACHDLILQKPAMI